MQLQKADSSLSNSRGSTFNKTFCLWRFSQLGNADVNTQNPWRASVKTQIQANLQVSGDVLCLAHGREAHSEMTPLKRLFSDTDVAQGQRVIWHYSSGL